MKTDPKGMLQIFLTRQRPSVRKGYNFYHITSDFKTPAGIEIGVFPEKVTIGYQGQIEEEYDLEDYMKITTDDATVEILSRHEAKHKDSD